MKGSFDELTAKGPLGIGLYWIRIALFVWPIVSIVYCLFWCYFLLEKTFQSLTENNIVWYVIVTIIFNIATLLDLYLVSYSKKVSSFQQQLFYVISILNFVIMAILAAVSNQVSYSRCINNYDSVYYTVPNGAQVYNNFLADYPSVSSRQYYFYLRTLFSCRIIVFILSCWVLTFSGLLSLHYIQYLSKEKSA